MAIQSVLSDDKSQLTVSVDGKFDYSQREGFSKSYEEYLDSVNEVIVDLKQTTYMDSAACGMLLILRDKISRTETKLSIVEINSQLQELFEAMDLSTLFNIVLNDQAK